MKKLMFLLFICSALSVSAQKLSFQAVAGLGGALSFGELRAYGISASAEPKIFIGNHIAAGLRFEGDVMLGGKFDYQNTENLTVGMSLRAAQTIKGEYYITNLKLRPYAGFGLGRFTQASIGASGSGDGSISASSGFGVAPEAGIAIGNFRLSAIFNVVPGKDIINIGVGDTQEVSKNYLVLQMSWKVFGIGGK